MRKFLRIMAPFGVLALAIGGFVALQATAPKPKEAEEEIRPVSLFVAEPEARTVSLSVTTQGEVRPRSEIDLVAQVGGRVVEISDSFIDGGIIKAGEVLVQLETADYELEVVRAQARVADAQLKLAQTEADAEIVRKQFREWLKEEPDDLASRKPHVAQAVAALRAAQADLESAKLNLQRTRLTVPFDGRIRSRTIAVGQVVNAGQAVAKVFSTDAVEVRLPLTDVQLAQMNLPLAFQATDADAAPKVELTATLAGKVRTWQGRIVRTAAAVDSSTRLVHAIAQVDDPYGAGASDGLPLAVGLFVTAQISGREVADATVIPRAALRTGDLVYVVDTDNRLASRKVQVIDSNPAGVIVADRFGAGERVVTSPVQNPTEGMVVEPLARQRSAQTVANLTR